MAIQTPIRGLRCFCVAAHTLSFKKTSNLLYLTPSAVSHQIKQLEEQLGFKLFVRKTRSLALTDKGYQFYRALNPIITELERTVQSYMESATNQSISIAVPEFFASELFIPSLKEWSELHPDINLDLDTMKKMEENGGNSDLSIVLSGSRPKVGRVYDLFAIKYVPACNDEIKRQSESKGQDILESIPLLLHRARPWAWHQWAEKHGISDFKPRKIIQLDNMYAVAKATQQGLGIALIPLPVSGSWFDNGLLYQVFDQELLTSDRYYLVQNYLDRQNQPIEFFIEWITAQFSQDG